MQEIYYTFGNHMHWVDMEWLWGYQALPGSVLDMLHYCRETGAKGNVNFDGIGYEKLAVEAPEVLKLLQKAIRDGDIEVVGASYGQPYGLFHGGESNARQRVYGVRSVLRLLGVRPRTFWEEEFDFFPQLPQLLTGVGFEYASLFFQWTWHTPEVPREIVPAVWWTGIDGSRLLTASRNSLNLHQWPEDLAELLAGPISEGTSLPGILQWLELMPSPDWMCRSELMLPQLERLMNHPDYHLNFVTLSEYLELVRDRAETRHYTLDDVFHGVSLGKNGDLFRRLSRRAEQSLLAAESLSALAGLFGRPYAGWDVYPTWELEEAWRELLAAQHHDNDECEGLCGHIGRLSYERSLGLSARVTDRTMRLLADRSQGAEGRVVVFNPLGWVRSGVVKRPGTGEPVLVEGVPACGYRVLGSTDLPRPRPVTVHEDGREITLKRGNFEVTVDRSRAVITQIRSPLSPNGFLAPGIALAELRMVRNGKPEAFERSRVRLVGVEHRPEIRIERFSHEGAEIVVTVRLADELDAVDIGYHSDELPRPDAGVAAALRTAIGIAAESVKLIHDHPFGVGEIAADGDYLRKYPTGDWMTSPQVFEEIKNPFTALQLLDITDGERGLLYLHDGSQAMLRSGKRVHNILSMYDPWDEDYFVDQLDVGVRLVPHGIISNSARWKLAQEFTRPLLIAQAKRGGGDLPSSFGAVMIDAPGVALTACYREAEVVGAGLEDYAGMGMEYPYILRIVEFDGEATTTTLRLPGPIAQAFQTNLLGEVAWPLEVGESTGDDGEPHYCELELKFGPHEIKTIYLDLVRGRKVARDLDAHRSVWATVHRLERGS